MRYLDETIHHIIYKTYIFISSIICNNYHVRNNIKCSDPNAQYDVGVNIFTFKETSALVKIESFTAPKISLLLWS